VKWTALVHIAILGLFVYFLFRLIGSRRQQMRSAQALRAKMELTIKQQHEQIVSLTNQLAVTQHVEVNVGDPRAPGDGADLGPGRGASGSLDGRSVDSLPVWGGGRPPPVEALGVGHGAHGVSELLDEQRPWRSGDDVVPVRRHPRRSESPGLLGEDGGEELT
jgi:hypothetical protein